MGGDRLERKKLKKDPRFDDDDDQDDQDIPVCLKIVPTLMSSGIDFHSV